MFETDCMIDNLSTHGTRALHTRRVWQCIVIGALALQALTGDSVWAEAPLNVFTTLRDLGDLAKAVGGDQVEVASMVKGPEDAHFIEAKPSFIKTLSQCDLYIQIGMDLEVGWAPVLLQNARNAAVLPGGRGHVDASTVIQRLEVPTGPVDRSMGDVHPMGNPHYLLDPLNGLKVARLIRDKDRKSVV